MKKALITGANKSIGLEAARQLLRTGYYVFLGSRDLTNGQQAVAHLQAEGLTQVEVIQLDVADGASVKAARETIGRKTTVLDVLINNAGISGGMPQSPLNASVELIKQVFDTNLFGVISVIQAFLDLLRQSPAPRIVNVTSGLGSLTLHSDPCWDFYAFIGAAYVPSKTALNAYTLMLAKELRDTPFKVNAVDPGYTATDFNHHRGTGTLEEAGARVVKYALLDANGPTGKFISEQANPGTGEIPW
jgi:NAD(P)-dependent dehydrogenase (short-subunit alcohol dehydrogenase family)